MLLNNDILLPLKVSVGKLNISLDYLKSLKDGDTITLNTLINDPLFIYIDNKLIATGEIVIIDGGMGIQIGELLNKNEKPSINLTKNSIGVELDFIIGTTYIPLEIVEHLERGVLISFDKKCIPPVVSFYVNNVPLNAYGQIEYIDKYFSIVVKDNNFIRTLKDSLLPIKEKKELDSLKNCIVNLEKIESETLANLLINENKVVIATILMSLDTEKSREILNRFPFTIQEQLQEHFKYTQKTNLTNLIITLNSLYERVKSLNVDTSIELSGLDLYQDFNQRY